MSRRLLAAVTITFALGTSGCEQASTTAGTAPSRFAAVKTNDPKAAAAKFCETTFEAGARKWTAPAGRPLPAPAKTTPNPKGKAWTWVNLWASWCIPCVEEMPLLGRWKSTLQKEGLPVRMELWTIDEEAEALEKALDATYPGDVRWLRSEDDLPGLLASLGLPEDAAIPVHGLVDPSGHLRCVRVGKVGAANYAAIRTIIGQTL